MAETRLDMRTVYIALFVVVFTLSVIITTMILRDDDEGEQLGPYTRSIDLQYDNGSELQMIQIAENITPPDGDAWYDTFDNIKLADCVCRESIDYYYDLIEDIEEDPDLLGIRIENAEMNYTAKVESFENNGSFNTNETILYKVFLKLNFHEYMGNTGAMWYDHYRTVVLTSDMEVLQVLGDDDKDSVTVS